MSLTAVREYAELARDIVVILGIPGLFAVGKWLYDQRIAAQLSQIDLLKSQLEEAKVLRYDNALAVIEAQKSAYRQEIEEKESSIRELEEAHGEKDQHVQNLQSDILALQEKISSLESAQGVMAKPSSLSEFEARMAINQALFESLRRWWRRTVEETEDSSA